MGCFAMKLTYEDQSVLFSTAKMAISTLFIPSFWRRKRIQLSILQKSNRPDKGMMKSFFGILKSEIFYICEKSLNKLLETTLVYYDKRIHVKLKGHSHLSNLSEPRKTSSSSLVVQVFSLIFFRFYDKLNKYEKKNSSSYYFEFIWNFLSDFTPQ